MEQKDIYIVYMDAGYEYGDGWETVLATFETLEEAMEYGNKASAIPDVREIYSKYCEFEESVDWESLADEYDLDQEFLKAHPNWTKEDLDNMMLYCTGDASSIIIKKLTTGIPAELRTLGWKYASNPNSSEPGLDNPNWIGL